MVQKAWKYKSPTFIVSITGKEKTLVHGAIRLNIHYLCTINGDRALLINLEFCQKANTHTKNTNTLKKKILKCYINEPQMKETKRTAYKGSRHSPLKNFLKI